MTRSARTGEELTHFLHVFPHVAFSIGTAQEKGGMKRRDDLGATAEVVELSPEPGNWHHGVEQRLGGERTEGDNDARLNCFDLLEQKRLAGRNFVRLRIPVLRRP